MDAIVFDYDGTLVDTFSSRNKIVTRSKEFCFRHFKTFYLLIEIFEMVCHLRWPVHQTSVKCLQEAKEQGLVVGIATQRSLWSFVQSARRNGFELQLLDFVHVRCSLLDPLVQTPMGMVVLRSSGQKDSIHGLLKLRQWLAAKGVLRVMMVGDSDQDAHAASVNNFVYLKVNRYNEPDLSEIYKKLY